MSKGVLADTTRCLGLFADEAMTDLVDRTEAARKNSGPDPVEPGLSEMTRAALRILAAGSKGFFLVVDGGLIDRSSRAKDPTRAIWETIEFDRAVGVAKEYARSRPDTLIVVASGQETGGLTITGLSGTPAKLRTGWGSTPVLSGEGMAEPAYAEPGSENSGGTAVDVPIAASGPGAAQFGRPIETTDAFLAMLRAIGGGYVESKGAATPSGDVNGDGAVNLKDVTLLLRMVVGLGAK